MNQEPSLYIQVQEIVRMRMKTLKDCQQQWRAYDQGDLGHTPMSGGIHIGLW
jgi:hypothetical protein